MKTSESINFQVQALAMGNKNGKNIKLAAAEQQKTKPAGHFKFLPKDVFDMIRNAAVSRRPRK